MPIWIEFQRLISRRIIDGVFFGISPQNTQPISNWREWCYILMNSWFMSFFGVKGLLGQIPWVKDGHKIISFALGWISQATNWLFDYDSIYMKLLAWLGTVTCENEEMNGIYIAAELGVLEHSLILLVLHHHKMVGNSSRLSHFH
jgi:hypothetical protein